MGKWVTKHFPDRPLIAIPSIKQKATDILQKTQCLEGKTFVTTRYVLGARIEETRTDWDGIIYYTPLGSDSAIALCELAHARGIIKDLLEALEERKADDR